MFKHHRNPGTDMVSSPISDPGGSGPSSCKESNPNKRRLSANDRRCLEAWQVIACVITISLVSIGYRQVQPPKVKSQQGEQPTALRCPPVG